jgi:hypothetical protein
MTNFYDLTSKTITLEGLLNIVNPSYLPATLSIWGNYNESVGGLESHLIDEVTMKRNIHELSDPREVTNAIATLYDSEHAVINTVKKAGHTHTHFSRSHANLQRVEQNVPLSDLTNVFNDILSLMSYNWDKTALYGDGLNKGLFSDVTPQSAVNNPTAKDLVDLIVSQAHALNNSLNYGNADPVLIVVEGAKTQAKLNSVMYSDNMTVAQVLASFSWINFWNVSTKVSDTNERISIVKPQETKLFWSVSPTITFSDLILDSYGFQSRVTRFGDCSNSMFKRAVDNVVIYPITGL